MNAIAASLEQSSDAEKQGARRPPARAAAAASAHSRTACASRPPS